jgi:DNA modification methylase
VTPYYQDDLVTIYHGDARDLLPSLAFDAIVTDAPYGVGIEYGAFDDTPADVRALADDLTPYLLASRSAAVLTGVPQMWMWPQPKWVLCWSYAPTTNQFSPWGYAQWQPILVYGKDPYLARNLGPRPTVFTYASPPDRFANSHPCPKPEPVMRWVVERTTLPTDTILDPFMGSGTTLVSAKDAGRRAIGIELEERYCEVAAIRCSQEVLGLSA